MFKKFILITIIMVFIAACTSEESSTTEEDVIAEVEQSTVEEVVATEDAVAVQPTEVVVSDPTIEPEVVVEPTAIPPTTVPPTDIPPTQETSSTYNGPAWASITLTNVATGEAFTLADFAGRTVFIEPMATWCTNCYAQQGRVAQAMGQLDSEDYVFISMSVGEQVTAGQLSEYANRNGFPQIFVIGIPEIVTPLVDEFGFTVTNPPATPHIIIAPDGTLQDLSTGRIESDALVEELTAIHNG